MEQSNHTKRRFGIFVVLILAVVIILFVILSQNTTETNNSISEGSVISPVKQCYIWNTEAGDKATLIVTTTGTNAEGSFSLLPAEKDSKTGIFTGTISALAGDSDTRIIHGWWNTISEGVSAKEELLVNLTDHTASVGFGVMREDGEGNYVYADVSKLSYQPVLQQTDCSDTAL